MEEICHLLPPTTCKLPVLGGGSGVVLLSLFEYPQGWRAHSHSGSPFHLFVNLILEGTSLCWAKTYLMTEQLNWTDWSQFFLQEFVSNSRASVNTFKHTWRSPGEGMSTHSSILAWRIPWTEEPGGLQSTGLQRVDTAEWLSHSLFFSFSGVRDKSEGWD